MATTASFLVQSFFNPEGRGSVQIRSHAELVARGSGSPYNRAITMGSLTRKRVSQGLLSLLLLLYCLIISLAPASAVAAGPKRVLMLYSDRSFAVSFALTSTFQTELAEQSKVPIEFHEVTLQGP